MMRQTALALGRRAAAASKVATTGLVESALVGSAARSAPIARGIATGASRIASPPSSSRFLTGAAAFGWNNLAAFAGRSTGFPVPGFLKTGITDAQARRAAEAGAVYLNRGLAAAYRLVAGRDVVLAAQASAALCARQPRRVRP